MAKYRTAEMRYAALDRIEDEGKATQRLPGGYKDPSLTGDARAVRLLLAAGASPIAVGRPGGDSPLRYAERFGRRRLAALLAEAWRSGGRLGSPPRATSGCTGTRSMAAGGPRSGTRGGPSAWVPSRRRRRRRGRMTRRRGGCGATVHA